MSAQRLAHDIDQTFRTNDVKTGVNVTFESMLLSPPLLRGLTETGFRRPSPIQLKAIPLARCGIDLIVQAKSGTGKTLVFTIAALDALCSDIRRAQTIILAPTREIAFQIEFIVNAIGVYMKGLKAGLFIGGIPLDNDRQNVQGCQIVVGAPGRVRHLIELGILSTTAVRMLVLDEADKLADKEFREDINFIFANTPESKQMMACSATYTQEMYEFLLSYMKKGRLVTPQGDTEVTLLGLKQFVYMVDDHIHQIKRIEYKMKALKSILSLVEFDQCFIFVNYVTMAESLSKYLVNEGFKAGYLSAGQTQEKRLKSLANFKSYDTRILVASELVARGIDAPSVNLVINFECPLSVASYLHRMGRAGRFGNYGLCITLISKNFEEKKFRQLLTDVGGLDNSVGLIREESTLACLWTHDFEDDVERLKAAPHECDEADDSLLIAASPEVLSTATIEPIAVKEYAESESESCSGHDAKSTESAESSDTEIESSPENLEQSQPYLESRPVINPESWLTRITLQIDCYVKYVCAVNSSSASTFN